jgi:hypothetical protein
VVIALAGRRIDAADSETLRFPLRNVPLVEQRLGELFAREGATALISSAACGADLVALAIAGRRRMRRRVVLPFGREKFRATSVTDRPGDWGPMYDRVLAELAPTGDIVILEGLGDGTEAYAATNDVILDQAAAVARQMNAKPVAVLVWEGDPRGSDDTTAAFGDEARKHGLPVLQVKTV